MLEEYVIQNCMPGPLVLSDLNLTLKCWEVVDLLAKFEEDILKESESLKIAIRKFYVRRLESSEYKTLMKDKIKDLVI